MSTAALAATLENASYFIEHAAPAVSARSANVDDALALCTQFRRRGIASLLLAGDADSLLDDLACSGRAFLHVLPAIPQARQALSEAVPMLDALAAGDLECAHGIALRSRLEWNGTEELEEDFLAMLLVAGLVLGRPEPMLREALARWEALVAEGEGEAPELDAMRALVDRDGAAFSKAMKARMKDFQAEYRRLQKNETIPEEQSSTEGKVSTFGIALVRLATHLGVPVGTEYPMVPALAFRGRRTTSDPDAWKTAWD